MMLLAAVVVGPARLFGMMLDEAGTQMKAGDSQ